MKTSKPIGLLGGFVLSLTILMSSAADPQLDSWLTVATGRYARLYETQADLTAGNARTTWSRGTINQDRPAYCGIYEISSSTEWVYIRTTGLGSHVMGPWYLNSARTQLFPNLPANQATLYRFPRHPAVPTTKTLTGLGSIGYFVDGVAMFDGRDAFYWNGSSEVGGGTGGLWNRDAYVNERVTFDPANAHQEQTGTYHYHANPIALRALLDDHVRFDSATRLYSEAAANRHHSPILGWVRDGFPIYGPYGYANPSDASSPIQRMRSGYMPRDGTRGTANLAATGRTTLSAWAARAYNRPATLTAAEHGPAVSTTYPLGRYLEDNEFIGDLGGVQGTDYDLDEHNGRFCETPEFPEGTYAYFVTIDENGAPLFPYNVGRSFFGNPTGSGVTAITESVVTNFVGGANASLVLNTPAMAGDDDVTLVWSSVEGGTYQVESSNDFGNWTVATNQVASQGTRTETKVREVRDTDFYRVTRTALAEYDAGENPGGGEGISSITPNTAVRGTSVTVTLTLVATTAQPVPPASAPVNSVLLGSLEGTNISRPTQTTVRATFAIPAGFPAGPYTVAVVFPHPQLGTVSLTGSNLFTVTQ